MRSLRARWGLGLIVAAVGIHGCNGANNAEVAPDPWEEACNTLSPVDVDARDATMTGALVKVTGAGGRPDVSLPVEVIDWLEEHGMQALHLNWHNVRFVDQNCGHSNATPDDCPFLATLINKDGLFRADKQQGAPGNSIEFLAMHRRMIQELRQAFPAHASLFAGFAHVPLTASDPENLTPEHPITWTPVQLKVIDTLDHIESHLDQFPTEDDLGFYMQAIVRWTTDNPTAPIGDDATIGQIHGALHGQWAVAGSPVVLGAGVAVQINNASFWKLHGWLDNIWQRYRVARGLHDTDTDYVQLLVAQCKEMHRLDVSGNDAH
jgi:hypothetical protein